MQAAVNLELPCRCISTRDFQLLTRAPKLETILANPEPVSGLRELRLAYEDSDSGAIAHRSGIFEFLRFLRSAAF